MSESTAGTALGLVSLAIAATELAAPRQLEEVMGIGDGEISGIFRVLGVRGIMHGFDLLAHDRPTQGLWGRVAGDLLDATAYVALRANWDRHIAALTPAMGYTLDEIDPAGSTPGRRWPKPGLPRTGAFGGVAADRNLYESIAWCSSPTPSREEIERWRTATLTVCAWRSW